MKKYRKRIEQVNRLNHAGGLHIRWQTTLSEAKIRSHFDLKLVNKKHFLLLEVLIAFVLIALCIIPLISPQTFILTQQKKFIQELEVNHLVNLAYADIMERLYRSEIPWNSIIQGNELEIDEAMLLRLRYAKKIPYKGYYTFSEIIHKPTDDSPRKLYLLNLNFLFIPESYKPAQDDSTRSDALKFHYELFVIRDLGSQNSQSEAGGEEKPPPLEKGGGGTSQ